MAVRPALYPALPAHAAYTAQYIRPAGEWERVAGAALWQRQDTAGETGEVDTAFLIEKTDQQTFLSLVLGVLATGLVYTSLLLFKPTSDCSRTNTDTEIARLASSASSLSCQAASQPFLTALALVWLPILAYTALSGYMVRQVRLLDEREDADEESVNIEIPDYDTEQLADALIRMQQKLRIQNNFRRQYGENNEFVYNLAF